MADFKTFKGAFLINLPNVNWLSMYYFYEININNEQDINRKMPYRHFYLILLQNMLLGSYRKLTY